MPNPVAALRSRPRLSRARVLDEALRLVDEEGLDALTMRALGARLGVEAMSIYNHVPSKQALRAGIVELLWDEVAESVDRADGWEDALRSLARRLREVAAAHPRAFTLLVSECVVPESMLRVFEQEMAVLQRGGFDAESAGKALNAVSGYALGYASMELACGPANMLGDAEGTPEQAIAEIMPLPAEADPELAQVLRDMWVDPDDQFTFGLDALLAGLESTRSA